MSILHPTPAAEPHEVRDYERNIIALRDKVHAMECRFARAKDRLPVVVGFAFAWNVPTDKLRSAGRRIYATHHRFEVDSDARAYVGHNEIKVLGSLALQSLDFHLTDLGLWAVFSPCSTPYADRALDDIRSGKLAGMSCGLRYTHSPEPVTQYNRGPAWVKGCNRVTNAIVREVSAVDAGAHRATCLMVLDDDRQTLAPQTAANENRELRALEGDIDQYVDRMTADRWCEAKSSIVRQRAMTFLRSI